MDDFYRNRSARLSDEIKRVVNETRVSIQKLNMYFFYCYLAFFPIIKLLILERVREKNLLFQY